MKPSYILEIWTDVLTSHPPFSPGDVYSSRSKTLPADSIDDVRQHLNNFLHDFAHDQHVWDPTQNGQHIPPMIDALWRIREQALFLILYDLKHGTWRHCEATYEFLRHSHDSMAPKLLMELLQPLHVDEK